jgi:hypothetical protein
VMCCSDHRQVLVSEFLFWPRRTPCCLVLDIPIRMICYWTPMRDFWSYYPWLSVVNIYFDPYLVWISKPIVWNLYASWRLKKSSVEWKIKIKHTWHSS